MKRTCAKIIIAAMLALLLVAGCKNDDDDEDDTPAVEYKVLAGRLILYSGDGANVIVPTGTASIGNNAFKGCARLGNVFIPASVTYIAGGAFRGVEIGYIAYGDTVAHWEEVVAGSSGLAASLAGQAVVCTDGVWNAPTNPNPGGEPDVPGNPSDWQITDGDGVLTAYTGSGTHVTVPDGVTAIGPGAFAGSDVTAADIPASVTSIGTGAFADGTVLTFHGTAEQWEQLVENSDLTGLTVVAVDDDGVLVGYSGNETHVTIPDGVTAIGPGAFAEHAEITDVTIPGSVTSIGDGAFSGCSGLTDVVIPGSVTGIGADAFGGCTGLTNITYGGSREQLEDLCADSGIDLSDVRVTISDEASVWDIRDGVLLGYYGTETDIVIPDDVTAIGDGAFAGNTGLTGVTIPDGVTSIGSGAFSGSGLTELTYTGDAAAWDALVEASGIADDLDGFTVACSDREWKPAHTHTWGEDYTDDKNGKHYQVCTECGKASAPAEHECDVTDNGDGTHRTDCTKCDYAKIEKHDYDGAPYVDNKNGKHYQVCTECGKASAPAKHECEVADNGDGTHRTDCTKCDYAKIEKHDYDGAPYVDDKNGKHYQVCTECGKASAPAEHECDVTDNGDGTHTMTCTKCEYSESEEHDYEDDTCKGCGCPKPSDWLIKDGVLLGYYGSETDIVIPDSVTNIGADAFAGNTGLTGVEIPAGVTSIGDGAFKGCTGLTDMTIPAGVTGIGADAFSGCTGLADLTIPASVTGIGAGALACGNLETIAFAGTVAQWVGLAAGSGVGDDVIVTCSDGTLPTTVYVAVTGSDDNPGSRAKPFATIQKAVDTIIARNDGSNPCTIYVDGTLTQSAAASANGMADFSALGKNLTLTIQSLSGTATLDANGKSRVIKAPASGALNLTLENLVITGGNTTGNGGGIYYQSTGGILTVKGCAITGNEANYGGGVYVYGGTFTMSGGTISNCTANSYGGGVYINSSGTFNMSGTAKIAGCKTTSTSSNSGGGGIYNVGTVTITGGTVSDCTSATNGGGVYVGGNNGKLTMSGGTISGNTASRYGGGVYVYSGMFTMEGGEISNCTAESYGGGVFITSTGTFNMSGTAKITGCKTTSTSGLGGGIYNEGTLAITGGSVSDCTSATSGGGVYVSSGTFTMSGGTIAGNTASSNGGGVFVYSGTFNLTDGTIGGTTSAEANTAINGGGVYVYKDTFTMEGGEISECTATDKGGGVFINSSGTFNMSGTAKIAGCKTTSPSGTGGGGIYNAGTVTITGGTVSDCTSATRGGGVYIYSGTFTMEGGEISNCTASSYGGGVYIYSGTFTMGGGEISNCTASSFGGGVYVYNGTFTMGGSASIPAGNDGKNDVNLTSGKTITVAGALTAATPVATITPSAYTEGTQVLGAGTGVTITQGICDKFAVTPQADGTKWKINLSGNTGVLKKDEVSTGGGGISVVLPTGTYTFKIESGGSEVVNGSKLQYGTSIVLSEVRKDGVLLTASAGTEWTIEIKDTGNMIIASATGYQAPVTIMPTNVPPIGMDMQIYVKVALTSGIVIDQTIQVTGP